MQAEFLELPRARTPEEVGLSSARLERMTSHWQSQVDAQRLPGAVAVLSRQGRIAHFRSTGMLDPARGAAMRDDAIFRIFSMTKPIVSVAVMMLVERGSVRLLEPVANWLPEFAKMNVLVDEGGQVREQPCSKPITVQDLLRHTSGLTYEFTGAGPLNAMYGRARLGDRKIDNAESIARLAKLPLLLPPGTRWEYSRATDVLGRLIEVVTGQSLGEFLRREVCEPLGMVDTAFHVPPDKADRIAEPLEAARTTPEGVGLFDPRRESALESGGGGLMSTAMDYARFLQMMLNGGILNGERLLSRKTVEFMTSDHLGCIGATSDLLPPGQGFGLGFAVRLVTGVSHFPGSVGSYYWGGLAGTAFWVDPVERFFAILMIQAPDQRIVSGENFRHLAYACFDD